MATSCRTCGSQAVTYEEDGAARCKACGAVTQPFWYRPPASVLPTPELPGPPAPVPTLRFVSPPPSDNLTPPLVAHRAPQMARGARQDLRQQRIAIGGLFIVIGLLVTVGTYSLASSSPGGGTYFIAFGPVIFGIYSVARGLTTPAGIPAFRYTPRVSRTVAAPGPTARPSSPIATAGASPGTARATRRPLVMFLVGLVLLLVGEAVSLMSFSAAGLVGDALGFPGIFLLILAPIWWAVGWVRHRAQ